MGRHGPTPSADALDGVRLDMAHPVEGAEYHLLTVLSPDGTSVACDTWTHWVRFEIIDGRRHEVREASIVDPARAYQLQNDLGRSPVFVSTDEQLMIFLAVGGTGIVEAQLARNYFPEVLAPAVCASRGLFGFRALESISDPQAFRRAPAPKRRMAVLNRDGRRCKVCGRCPDDFDDLCLRVHHVRPWSEGGLTEEQNLVTLCHTCHDGLDPHFDPSLFRYTAPDPIDAFDSDYAVGIRRYREMMSRSFGCERGPDE